MKILEFPELRQVHEWDCGANALQSVLVYYGIEVREELIIKCAKTNDEDGTFAKNMEHVLDKYDLNYEARKMTLKDLRNFIDKKFPVILLVQAWNGHKKNYTDDWNDGHWVVLIGYNKTNMIFEDPYTFERTYLTNKELRDRWHSREGKEKIRNFGIAVFGRKKYDSAELIHMD